MPTIRERASETLKLLEEAQTSADTLDEMKMRSNASLRLMMERDANNISAQKRFDATTQQVKLSNAELKIIQERKEAAQKRQDQYDMAASNLKARADKFSTLSPQQQFLARKSGELGAVINAEMNEELSQMAQRLQRSGESPRDDPGYQQLSMDLEVFRQHEVNFMERYGQQIQYQPNGTPLLPWDQDYVPAEQQEGGSAQLPPIDAKRLSELRAGGTESFVKGLLGKTGAGVAGGAGIIASAAGFEETGAKLAGAGAEFNESMSAPNLADRAAELEMGDIVGRASLEPDDPRFLSPSQAAIKAVALAATDIDAAQNIASSLGAATLASGGVGGVVRGGVNAFRKGAAAYAGTNAVKAGSGGAVLNATGASLAGAGQSVDETLETPQARILAGASALSGGLGAFGTTAESALGQAARALTPGLKRNASTGSATTTLGGAARGTAGTSVVELGQGSIDNAAESFGEFSTEKQLGVGDTLANPEARDRAILAAQVNAPLEAFAGGAVGGVTGAFSGFEGGRRVKREEREQAQQDAVDARKAQKEEAIATQQARADAQRAKNFKDRGIDLGQGPNDPKATLRNMYVDDIEAEANFEALRDVPADTQEISLRALYRSQENLDNAGEDAFITEFFKDGPMPGDTTYLDFLDKLDAASVAANSPETLAEDVAANAQARQDQRTADAQAQQGLDEEQAVVDLQEQLTASTTERDGTIDENPTPDTPIQERGRKKRIPATFQTEFLDDFSSDRSRMKEFLDTSPEDQELQLRALYRNSGLAPGGDKEFARGVLTSLGRLGSDVSEAQFDKALAVGSILSGNSRDAIGTRQGADPATVAQAQAEAQAEAENLAQQSADKEQEIADLQSSLTQQATDRDGVIDENPDPSTPIRQRNRPGRVTATFQTELLGDDNGDAAAALQDLDPETQETTIRALYRNSNLDPSGENTFTRALMNTLNSLGEDLSVPDFDRAVRAASLASGNDRGAAGIRKGPAPVDPAVEEANQAQQAEERIAAKQASLTRKPKTTATDRNTTTAELEQRGRQTFDSRFFENPDSTTNLQALINEDPDERDATVRALYRNQSNLDQTPGSEDTFAATIEQGLNYLIGNGTLNNITFAELVGGAHLNTGKNDARDPAIFKGLPPTKDQVQKQQQEELRAGLRNLVNWQAINDRAANDSRRRAEELDDVLIPQRQQELGTGATLTNQLYSKDAESNLECFLAEDTNSREVTVRALVRQDSQISGVNEEALVEALVGLPDTATEGVVRRAVARVVNDSVKAQSGEKKTKIRTRPQIVKIFDTIQKSNLSKSEARKTAQRLNPVTGRLVERASTARVPARDAGPDTTKASVNNTLLADLREATKSGGEVTSVTEAAMSQLASLDPEERSLAYRELAKRDGMNPSEQGVFADTMMQSDETLLGDTGDIGQFRLTVEQALVAAGRSLRSTKAADFYNKVNSLVSGGDTDVSAEGMFDVDDVGRATLTPEARQSITQIQKDKRDKADGVEAKAAAGFSLTRNRLLGTLTTDSFSEQQAVSALRDLQLVERARKDAGK